MALHEFTFKGVGPRWIRARFQLLLILMSVAASAIPGLVHAQVAVPFSANVQFANTSQVATYVVNLGTLPLRPELIVNAIASGSSNNLQLQIEITQVQIDSPGSFSFCPDPANSILSAPGSGPAHLVWKIWTCDPEVGALAGETARVNVRTRWFLLFLSKQK